MRYWLVFVLLCVTRFGRSTTCYAFGMVKWNETTWYSRLIGILVFLLALPVICFFLGYQFRDTLQVLTESGAGGISAPTRSWVREFNYKEYVPGKQVAYTCAPAEFSGQLNADGSSTLTPTKTGIKNPADANQPVTWTIHGNRISFSMGSEVVYESYIIPVTFPAGDKKVLVMVDRKLISGAGCGVVIADSKAAIERYTR